MWLVTDLRSCRYVAMANPLLNWKIDETLKRNLILMFCGMSRFQVNFIEKRCKTMHFRAEIQGADGRAVREKEVVHGSRFGIESKEERYPGYHANQESLPIRADAKRRTYPQDEAILRMCAFRIQSCASVSESAV